MLACPKSSWTYLGWTFVSGGERRGAGMPERHNACVPENEGPSNSGCLEKFSEVGLLSLRISPGALAIRNVLRSTLHAAFASLSEHGGCEILHHRGAIYRYSHPSVELEDHLQTQGFVFTVELAPLDRVV